MKRLRLPPGPRGHPVLGSLPEFRRDPLGFAQRCARDYGDIVHLRIAGSEVYFIFSPEYVSSVLVANARNFNRGRVIQASRTLMGNGLFVSDGDLWLRQRRLIQPAFHPNAVAAYADQMVGQAQRMLAQWNAQASPQLDIHQEMKALTLQIVAGALFSADLSASAVAAGRLVAAVWEQFSRRVAAGMLIPESWPTLGNLRLRRAVRQLDDIIYDIIAHHETSSQDSGDLLSVLLRASGPQVGAMSRRQLRDEVMTLFVAGHETTALALTWIWYLLAQHPQVEERLLAELRSVLNGRAPGAADVAALKYTGMVVQEALRLYPPVWAVPRLASAECEIGGYSIPAGASVTMFQWVTQRDPRYFHEPERFNPDRWAEGAREIPKFAYFPFGGGPHQCIGMGFAQMEAVLLLATIAQAYHFDLLPGQRVVLVPSLTLYPRDGLRVVAARR